MGAGRDRVAADAASRGIEVEFTERAAVSSLDEAAESARAALAGFRAAPAWPAAPRPVAAIDLLPERALVRCTVAGACERATDWVKGQEIGFPG
jgi:hypothetical protein